MSQPDPQVLEFDLTEEDIVLPTECPVLGIPIQLGLGANHPNIPHVDRVDNSRGYVKENVRVISARANTLKRDATLDEIAALHRYMSTSDNGRQSLSP